MQQLWTLIIKIFQMEKVEQDLNRSKQLREKQTREYQQHIEDQQTQHQQRVRFCLIFIKKSIFNYLDGHIVIRD